MSSKLCQIGLSYLLDHLQGARPLDPRSTKMIEKQRKSEPTEALKINQE